MKKLSTVVFIVIMAIGLLSSTAQALTITSNATGNWSAGGTWVGGSPPGLGDDVVIANGHTVTVNGVYSCASLTVNTGNQASGITISGTNSLAVTNNVIVYTSTLNGQSKTINVGSGTLTIGANLNLYSDGGNKETHLLISTGTVDVTGSVVLNTTPGKCFITFSGAGLLRIGGNFTSGGTFTASNGTVYYNGSGAQQMGNYSYYNLKLSNSGAKSGPVTILAAGTLELLDTATYSGTAPTYSAASSVLKYSGSTAQSTGAEFPATMAGSVTINNANGVTLSVSKTINGTLTLTTGIIYTQTYKLTIGTTGSVSRPASGGYVNGNFEKYYAVSGTPSSKTFEIGGTSLYTPVVLSFATVTTGGYVSTKTYDNEHGDAGNSGINPGKSVNRYWDLTPTTIAYSNYDVTFYFHSSDIDPSADPDNFIASRGASGTWTRLTNVMKTDTSTQIIGVTSMSDFVIGEPAGDMSIDNVTSSEGNSGTTSFTFNITLASIVSDTVKVNYSTANGTATLGDNDYEATSGQLVFDPGQIVKTVTVNVNGDDKYESNETFYVNLTDPINTTFSDNQGLGTVNNDDAQPTISIDDVTLSEGNSGITAFDFTVTLSNASYQSVTIDYATADNSATTADNDYTAITTTTITFNENEVSKQVTVNVTGDTKYETTEDLYVDLSNAVNGTISDNQGLGTINNDDAQPTIAIDDVTLSEGNSGTTSFDFTVSLSNASYQTITVDYATSDGTATSGEDYSAITSPITLTFNPDDLTQQVSISVNGDTKYEANEAFNVDLTNPTNSTISDVLGLGTINNDDSQPSISIDDVSLSEGDAGTTSFGFTVTMSNLSDETVTVDFATSNGSATAGEDYSALPVTTLTFNPGDISKPVAVLVDGDTKYELNETFYVDLTNAGNGSISDNQGLGTINNDDVQPTISIDDITLSEGNSGTTSFDFTVTLSNLSDETVTVDYATSDGTATVADNDYTAVTTTTLTFNPGDLTKPVSILVNGDTKYEATQTFNIDLTNATNSTISDALGLGTINNDDSQPSISIDDVSLSEGDAGTTSFDFTVTLSNLSDETVTVDYATSDGTATVVDNDYTAVTTTTLTFNPGDLTKPVSVLANGDTKNEANETFNVDLTNAGNATIGDNLGLGTINNDDVAVSISIDDVTLSEGDAGTTSYNFTVSLSAVSGQTVTVDYATSDGSATASEDYTAVTATTLTFNPGDLTKPVSVSVNGDTKYETNETFNVDLTNATNATISDNLGLGTILNDDAQPSISINDIALSEGSKTSFGFTVSLSNASYETITINYTTADGSATLADNDYITAGGTITFNPNEITKPLTVTVNNDTKYETNEDFYVNLSVPTNATISDNQGFGTIQNDDIQPAVSIDDVTLAEGNSGTTSFGFTVSLSNTSYQTITVNYATADNSATIVDNDYQTASGTLTFNPNDLTKPVTVLVNGDLTTELTENFYLNLSSPTNAAINDGQGVGTITNDDELPTISINDVSMQEGSSGTTSFDFTATLSNASSSTVTVEFATNNGTATTGDNDYIANQGTVTFNPGEIAKPVSVLVNGDNQYESDEAFYVDLTSPTNATINDAQGIGTIENDDNVPTIVINNVAHAEGDSLTATFEFTVNLTSTTIDIITVDYSTGDGSATLTNNDYIATSGIIQFNPGEDEKTIEVSVNGDYFTESNEIFYVGLTNPVNATITDGQGVGTILNDDAGWLQCESVPNVNDIKTGKHVKDGACMTAVTTTDDLEIIYALHGNKSRCFLNYTPGAPGVWSFLESIPLGYKSTDLTKINKKKVAKGSALCWDGNNIVYATKGNTNEFWAYYINADGLIPADTWIQKSFLTVPKKVKGGTSIIWYDGKVYMLAGGQKAIENNFFSYDPTADTIVINGTPSPWSALASAPTAPDNKAFKDGSSIARIGDIIYALKGKGKHNYFYAYDMMLGTWIQKETIPLVHPQTLKKVKVGDGGAMISDNSMLYAIKGGGKLDFWGYLPNAIAPDVGEWFPLDTIPRLNGFKKSVVKAGGALVYANGEIYLLKGNNSSEFWKYLPASMTPLRTNPTTISAITSLTEIQENPALSIYPNPFTDNAQITYSVPVTGKVSIKLYNTTGQLVNTIFDGACDRGIHAMTMNANGLVKGVYFLKYETNNSASETKLIIQ